MHVAYVNYGDQSGVTAQITRQLLRLGHTVTCLNAMGPLEFRGSSGRRRVTLRNVANLALAAARFRERALEHRWSTRFAFDTHSRSAARLIRERAPAADLVLQNGAIFSPSPGAPSPRPYVLYCDYTRALAMQQPAYDDLPPPLDLGRAWHDREKAVYDGAATILTFSTRVARSLATDYGYPAERTHVVGAGANVFPERVARADDGRTILFVGKQFARKGGHVLLRAFRMLRARRPDVSLLIAGPREQLELPEGARQLGEVPIAELPATFARASVFCMPTLREPFGIAYLDAMACGVPAVGTHIEAVPEIIEPGVTGATVPPDDPRALASVLEGLLADPERLRAMGAAARARVEARWRWSHVGDRVDTVLSTLVSERTRAQERGITGETRRPAVLVQPALASR